MASGWNLWVKLQCIGVVSGCCKEGSYIDILTIMINFPYTPCISSFFGSSIPTSLFIFKMFFQSLRIRIRRRRRRRRSRNGDFLLRAART